MKKKFFIFLILFLFIINIYTSCFAYTVSDNGNSVTLPNFTPSENYSEYFVILKQSGDIYYLYSLASTGGNCYYQSDNSRLRFSTVAEYTFNPNTDNSWVFVRDYGGKNLYDGGYTILLSNFNIYYSGTTNIFFEKNYFGDDTPVENVFGCDTLYIGDIPLSFEYAEFSSDYVTLYSQASATNEDITYYRIYFVDNAFYYSTGTTHFDTLTNFQKINVTNNFFYRRDFVNICLTTFIIIIFFLWVTNLFTSIIYKGGILRGLF